MKNVSVSDIKRRGMNAISEAIASGPAYITKHGQAKYVVMSLSQYESFVKRAAEFKQHQK
jgi:prevent-host-death family protein